MRPALKVVPTTDPARAALAAAIANAKPVQAEVEEAQALAQSGRVALEEAMGAVPAAERAVAESKARLIENPAGDRAELRAYRQAVTDAVDDLDIAKQVAARTQLAFVDAERSAKYVTDAVQKAADAVIAARFSAALDAAERAAREFARLAFAARFIASSGDASSGERARLVDRVDALNPGMALRRDFDIIAATQQEAETLWIAARAALLTDPDALLPVIQ